MRYADIIVDLSLEALDRIFQYIIPDPLSEQIGIGSVVVVPFGRSNRKMKGYVVAISEETDYDPEKIKPIQSVEKTALPVESHMFRLAAWMSRRYGCTRAQALRTVLSVKRKIRGGTEKWYRLLRDPDAVKAEMKGLEATPRFGTRCAILALMLDYSGKDKDISEKEIHAKIPSPEAALKTLEKHGWIQRFEKNAYRIPYRMAPLDHALSLNPEQERAVSGILTDPRRIHLLHGITGSGKTEVYMALIEHLLAQGKQTIVLIPEIGLTYQNIKRFQQRFGAYVSVMHSKMSDGERYDQYMRAKNGEIHVMIGPRMALFTPFQNLGMIIIDEEHDGAYKSDVTPKYHAIDVAAARVQMCEGKLILGSATPSVSTYYKAEQGIYGLHTLTKRAIASSALARTEIVDLRQELKEKNYSVFSRRLQEEIEDRLIKKEQTLLFLNRRGYAGFISCRSCGHVLRCPRCDVSLTYHKYGGPVLKCHYCDFTMPMPDQCPECGSKYIGTFGMGTEKVVEMLKKRFPEARVLRADADILRKKKSHDQIFESFAKGEADILVGTQMIVKGHDFPNVTLVGILAADLSLFSGDYQSSERTFQLLTQAIGRAGRREKEGLALIQTYQPDNYAVLCAGQQDYHAFYRQELLYRKMLKYPPFGYFMVAVLEGEDSMELANAAKELAHILKQGEVQVLTPTDAFREKEKDTYRKVIYIKSPSVKEILNCRDQANGQIQRDGNFKKIKIQFDINPMNIY